MASPSGESSLPGQLSFTWAGIPFRIHTSFWIATLVIGAGGGGVERAVTWVAVVFASVVWHELGHAWMARRFGRTARIELHAMGGTTFHQGDTPLGTGRDIAISLAGPGAGFLLGALAVAAQRRWSGTWADWALAQLIWVNLGYGALNLLPILPLDGGQVMRSLVRRIAPRRAELASEAISLLAIGVLAWAALTQRFPLRTGLFLLAWLAIARGRSIWSTWQRTRDEPLLPQLTGLWDEPDPVAQTQRAEALAGKLRWSWNQGRARNAWAYGLLRQDRPKEALEVLTGMPAEQSPSVELTVRAYLRLKDPLRALQTLDSDPSEPRAELRLEALAAAGRLTEAMEQLRAHAGPELSAATLQSLCGALFYADRFAEALEVCQRNFAAHGHATDAYNAACCLSRLGQLDQGLAWLGRAFQAGWTDRPQLESDPDLAALRAHPGYPY